MDGQQGHGRLIAAVIAVLLIILLPLMLILMGGVIGANQALAACSSSGPSGAGPLVAAQDLHNAGLTDHDTLVLMVAIAGAESGWVPTARNDTGGTATTLGTPSNTDGSVDFGLWQINNRAHPQYFPPNTADYLWILDSMNNATAAWAILEADGTQPWTGDLAWQAWVAAGGVNGTTLATVGNLAVVNTIDDSKRDFSQARDAVNQVLQGAAQLAGASSPLPSGVASPSLPPIPSGAPAFSGPGSWFGGPDDPSSGPTTASGAPVSQPGIAVHAPGTVWNDPVNQSRLGGYWLVTYPNGRTIVLQQTDMGPSAGDRVVDTTYATLTLIGYTEQSYPTDATVSVVYLGKGMPWAQYAASSFSSGTDGACPNGSVSGIRAAIVAYVRSQVGVTESPPGSNCVVYWNPPDGSCVAWCAKFASFAYHQAGVPWVPGQPAAFQEVTYVGGLQTWAQQNGLWKPVGGAAPVPGDLALWYSSGSSPPWTHVSVVVAVNGSQIETVDGNWGNSVADRPMYSIATVDPADGQIAGFVAPVAG